MSVKVFLKNLGAFKYEAINSAGKIAVLDGPSSIGGTDDGIRPMEMILMGLAGCSSFDVLSILKKQRQELDGLDVEVEGERADAVPAVYTKIHLKFIAKGMVSQDKLEKAIQLSMDKYCSVSAMLIKTAEITHSIEIIE